jgi:hypothetical protein
MIKDKTDIDVQYSMSLVPCGRPGTVIDKIQGM